MYKSNPKMKRNTTLKTKEFLSFKNRMELCSLQINIGISQELI